jgi:CheY-like chemotaxis protein
MTTVLVVDDDATVVNLLKSRLEKNTRFTVLEAGGGAEALAIIAKQVPDVLLCDVDMPGMDGITLANILAKNEATEKLPLIFLSSMVTPEDMKGGVTAGGGKWPMISKSSTMKELIAMIDRVARVATA